MGGGSFAVAKTFDHDLNDLIGAIYDATIEPERWHDTLEVLRRRFAFESAMLGIVRADGSVAVEVSCNVAPEYLASVAKYADDIPKTWGGVAGFARLPLEEPLLNSEQPGFRDLESNRYYTEWAKPQGLVDQCVIPLANGPDVLASLGLGIHERRSPLSESERDDLRILGPHLRRAAIISGILDRSAEKAATFEAVLDAIGTGAALVGADLRIIHANEAAEKMLEAGDPIRKVSGRLDLVSEVLRGSLASAVAAVRNEAGLGRRGIAIPAIRGDGKAVAIHVMPLERRTSRQGIVTAAVAAVFVADGRASSNASTDTAMLLYDLTPAEARVFELVVAGRSNPQMSTELGIRPSTLRTHLLRVFDKTGRHTRGDLVRLASEIRLPL